ncbi:ABC transporter ATP-binding protein, partial [Enterococcus faecium]
TLGTLVSFLALNRSFTNPITQISQQINSVIMAMAGADRVFNLLDAEVETDEGYVELVNATENAAGNLQEVEETTGMWA